MASLLKAFGNMFREKRDKAAQALADPIRDGKFAIEDSKTQIREYTTQVAKLRAETIKTEKEHQNALAEKKKWENIAKQAGAAKNEEDVRKAVGKMTEWKTRAAELKKQIDANTATQKNLQTQLERARTKVTRAEQNHQTLAARKKGAEIRKSLAQASQQFAEGQGGLAALDDLDEAVRQDEAEAQAFEEMSAPADDEGLDEKYSAGSADEEDLVAKFMEK
ncbi:MAG: PspA/IM30 family protein [Promethearchaeota archaeon]|jgi:phage shock protein A